MQAKDQQGIVRKFPASRDAISEEDDQESTEPGTLMLWVTVAGLLVGFVLVGIAWTRPVPSTAPEPSMAVVPAVEALNMAEEEGAVLSSEARGELLIQLDVVESLVGNFQFGDALRFVAALETDYPAGTRELAPVLSEVLDNLDADSVLSAFDVLPLQNLAQRGNDEAAQFLIRKFDQMPTDDGMVRASAEVGHLPAILELAKLLETERGRPGAAETWYRRAAELGSDEAADWLSGRVEN